MAGKIILVTGGQRSGKSRFAEKKVLELSAHPTYIATAQPLDDDFRERVRLHQERRGNHWTTLEEPIDVASLSLTPSDSALFECVTMWATNCFFHFREDTSQALAFMRRQIDGLAASGADIVFVTNEIGLGGISPNAMQRHFTDLQGAINSYIASISSEVFLIISGIPMKIK